LDGFRDVYPRHDNKKYNETIQKMLSHDDPKKMSFGQCRCPYCRNFYISSPLKINLLSGAVAQPLRPKPKSLTLPGYAFPAGLRQK
jgi:hypothetical protein